MTKGKVFVEVLENGGAVVDGVVEVRDGATGAAGSWHVRRRMRDAPVFMEYWNDDFGTPGRWTSAASVYGTFFEALGAAVTVCLAGKETFDEPK